MCGILVPFLRDGERLLVYQIPIMFSKTYSLAEIVDLLKGHRFYGCPLLLIYEGYDEIQGVLISQTCEQPSSGRRGGMSLERGRTGRKHRSGSSPGRNPSTSTPKFRQPSDAGSETPDQDSPLSWPHPTPLH